MIVGTIHGMRRGGESLTKTGLTVEVFVTERNDQGMIDIEVTTEEGYPGMLLANGTRKDVDDIIHALRALRERLPE